MNHILEGRDLLSPEYVKHLESFELYNGECAACHRTAQAVFVREGESLYVLCAACREARTIWSDTLGRKLTILETESVMGHVASQDAGYGSILDLVNEVVREGVITA